MKVTGTQPLTGPQLRHAAGFFDGPADVAGQVSALVAAELAAGGTAVVSVSPGTEHAVRMATGAPVGLRTLPRPSGPDSGSGQTVALHLARALRELTAAVGPVALFTEHTADLDGADGGFWTELDAAVNVAMRALPVRLTCFFPEMPLHLSVLEGAHRNHPHLLVRGELRHNAGYLGPQEVLRRHPAPAPELLGVPDLSMRFRAWQLHEVRRAVHAIAGALGFTTARTEDVVLAVNEVATNAIEHGALEAELSVWAGPDGLVCEVHDRGELHDRLPGLHAPHPSEPRGRGLWIARQICDLLHVWADGAGTHVRVRAAP